MFDALKTPFSHLHLPIHLTPANIPLLLVSNTDTQRIDNMNTEQKGSITSTPSIAVSESTLVPEQGQYSASSQSAYDNESTEKQKLEEEKPLTKKQKARCFAHIVLDGIVKAGTGGGMGT